jgi:hypothetical protein
MKEKMIEVLIDTIADENEFITEEEQDILCKFKENMDSLDDEGKQEYLRNFLSNAGGILIEKVPS